MREQLIMLHELHQTDARIHDLDLQLAEAPKESLATKAALDKIQSQLNQKVKQQGVNELERRRAEGELVGEKEKVHKWEARLNDIRNSREFAALQRETEVLKRQNRDSEEKIFDLTAEGETLTKEINELSEESDTLQDKYQEQARAADKLVEQLQSDTAELRAGQQKVREELKPSVLRKYERILKGRGGLALVMVHKGTCAGCHMTLPPQLFIELQRCNQIETCPNCQRILFWDGLLEKDEDKVSDEKSANANA